MEKVEEINKKYWFACQRFVELQAMERAAGDGQNPASSSASGSLRFREIMLCLPEVRYVAGKLLNCNVAKLPLLFKVMNDIACKCKQNIINMQFLFRLSSTPACCRKRNSPQLLKHSDFRPDSHQLLPPRPLLLLLNSVILPRTRMSKSLLPP